MGVKDRLVLSDAAWDRMAPLIIGRPDQKGSTGRDGQARRYLLRWMACRAQRMRRGQGSHHKGLRCPHYAQKISENLLLAS